MMRKAVCGVLAGAMTAGAVVTGAWGQCESWTDVFRPETFGSSISAVAVFDNGSGPRLIVSGSFDRVGDEPISGVASWDGPEWSSFGWVEAFGPTVLEADHSGDEPRLFAWSPGEKETVFVFEAGQWRRLPPIGESWIEVLRFLVADTQAGSRVFACGRFFFDEGFAPVVEWDGEAWIPFITRESSRGEHANDMLWIDDEDGGSLYVGGCFSLPAEDWEDWEFNLARWDGQEWHGLGWSDWPIINRLAAFDDGSGERLYVSYFDGVSRLVGSEWETVADGRYWGHTVFTDLPFGDGEDLVWNGSAYPDGHTRLWRWNGGEPQQVGGVVDGKILTSIRDEGGTFGGGLIAGGAFRSVDGKATSKLASFDGQEWHAHPGVLPTRGVPDAISVHRTLRTEGDELGGRLFVGADGDNKGLHEWNGESWMTISPEGAPRFTPVTFARGDVGEGERLYVGGDISSGGQPRLVNIASWDGAVWSAVTDRRPNGVVRSLLVADVFGDDLLFAGGEFERIGSDDVNYIAVFDGRDWAAMGVGLDRPVHAMAIHDDGLGPALYVAGDFEYAGGAPASHVAHWDGESWSPVGEGLSRRFMQARVTALAVADLGEGPRLFAAGTFNRSGETHLWYVAVWDGESWQPLGEGLSPQVFSLGIVETPEGSRLLAGGAFVIRRDGSQPGVAAWDGSTWTPFAGGADGEVRDIWSGGRGLYMAGEFELVGGTGSDGVAGWGCLPGSCRADWDEDGHTDSRDVVAYLRDWAAGRDRADTDGDGDIDEADFVLFLAEWSAGC